MSGLAIEYSKEIARELTYSAVVLPGSPVEIGDVIRFPSAPKVWIGGFRVPRPWGSFQVITKLGHLGMAELSVSDDESSNTYVFSSRKGATVSFDMSTHASDMSKGVLTVNFSRESAVYFAGVNCRTRRLTNLPLVERTLLENFKILDWRDHFVVVSVTTAERALIMQSSSDLGELVVVGDINGLVPRSDISMSATAAVSIEKYRSSSFIKPWSSNVPVFFGLARIERHLKWMAEVDKRFAIARASSLNVNEDDWSDSLVPVEPELVYPDDQSE